VVRRRGPVLSDRLPANIVDVIAAIVAAVRRDAPASLQEQLDSTLPLVCWSGVAARCGVQLAMIDALIDAGAAPAENAHNALVNGHIAAAERLVARGGHLTLATALCLGRLDEVPRLAAAASARERQFAFVSPRSMAVPMRSPGWRATGFRSTGEPGSLRARDTVASRDAPECFETVKALDETGADVTRPDSAWNGTPLGWASYVGRGT
jgi:peptide-methionine (S)-S-oxide reductase